MKRGFIFSIVVLVVGVFQLGQAFGAQSGKPISLKWGSTEPLKSPEVLSYNRVADIVKQKTNGRIQIKGFHGGALGGRKAMFEGLKMGTVDIFALGINSIVKFDPDRLKICGLMYGFRDRDHLRKFLKSSIFQEAQQNLLKNHGFRTISTKWNYDRGPYRVFVSRTPVFRPEDLKGMKMRMWPAEIPRWSWIGMGASPIVIEWAEAYIALRQGIADAITSPVSSLWPMKFTEVLKYVVILDQFPQSVSVLMSERTWKTLSPADQKIIVDAVNEGGIYYTKLAHEGAERDIQKMMDQHGAVFIRVSLKPWREKMKSITRDLEKRNLLPKGLYDKVQAIK